MMNETRFKNSIRHKRQRLNFCRDLTGSVEDATEVASSNLILVKRRTSCAFNTRIKFGTCEMRCLHRALP